MSKILRAMTKDGSARIFVINSTDIVNKAMKYHETAPTAAAALGRTLTATSLMGSTLKNKGDSLSVNFRGDGPCGHILAVSDYMGNVKGYIQNPHTDIERKPNGKLDVGTAVGKGTVVVIKDMGEKEPYNGIVPITTGEIAEDITHYFAESEQIPTLCALGVLVNPDMTCKAAGGVLVQLLPFADPNTVDLIEKNAPAIASVSKLIASGMSNEDIAKMALNGIEFDIFDEYFVDYFCDCSRERMGRGLLTLNPYELWNMLVEDGQIETCCQFCKRKYVFVGSDIEKLREKIKKEKEQKPENDE